MTTNITQQAIEVLKTEADGLLELATRIDDNFTKMVEIICEGRGRLIISGIGKSGIVGQKIVATLNSTGTRAIFLHPVEAIHGDLGMVGPRDIFLGLSNSGETEELNNLLPTIREIGCRIIAFTGNPASSLARQSDITIDVGITREACPLGLAPTTSTTAVMAMGDALAVALIHKKNFRASDFQKFHPGGALGQRLAMNISEIMLVGEAVPRVQAHTQLIEALNVLDRINLGTVLIVSPHDMLTGILTDGDVRRMVIRGADFSDLSVDSVMTSDPLAIYPDRPVFEALNIMEHHQITVLPVIDEEKKLCGILHLHDILGKGAFKFNGK
ncbi:MAG: KpsF/GutQ family sugar-phosphate isomerase [Thermodesulfobacteriota bacterium]|nr:KpsF/GutQ family sugar-phosphate isomerase [Thermodesulfobacteriota bacterium]